MNTNEKIMQDNFELIVDSHNGIYSGQAFAQRMDYLFNQDKIKGISKESWQTLLNGPEEEFYNDCCAELDNIELLMGEDGKEIHSVYWNEDIFIYPAKIHNLIQWDELN